MFGHMAKTVEQYFDRLERNPQMAPLVKAWRFQRLAEAKRNGDSAQVNAIVAEERLARARAASTLFTQGRAPQAVSGRGNANLATLIANAGRKKKAQRGDPELANLIASGGRR